MQETAATSLVDRFQRRINYVRLSVTDRCDFRCTYCMAEDMTFLPRRDVLTLEELARIARVLVRLGVAKLRVTGGEPLIRRDVCQLFQQLGALDGLEELAVTTNGSQLVQHAAPRGRGRNNNQHQSRYTGPWQVSRADTDRQPDRRAGGHRGPGGFPRIRLNAVILRGVAKTTCCLCWTLHWRELDIAFIEEMPLGQVNLAGKPLEFVASHDILATIGSRHGLREEAAPRHGGPARYWQVDGGPTRLGLISPHSNNFCASCNRLRVTAEGQLLLCLGNDHAISLRDLLRDGATDAELGEAIRTALMDKPEQHVFAQPDQPQIMRFMNASGG